MVLGGTVVGVLVGTEVVPGGTVVVVVEGWIAGLMAGGLAVGGVAPWQ